MTPPHLRRPRRGFLRLAGTCALIAGLAWSAVAAPAPLRPNIIFIMADDLGYGDLGCYGSEAIATPHLDRLAREGMRFTHAYSGSPVCAPARYVLMTGRHTGRATIRDNNPREGGQLESFAGGTEGGVRLSIGEQDRTVAEWLRDAGYATGITGKWGLAEPDTAGTPNRRGFDEWLGYLNQNHAAYYYTDRLDENGAEREIPANRGGHRAVYSNDLMADFAEDFVRRHARRPFFLYLPFTIPHDRMEVPELGDYARRDWTEDAKIYAAMVTRLDGYVGRLLALLAQLGIEKDTLVFFTSDNGPVRRERTALLRSTGGLSGHKATLLEGGIRVPMLVRWPGRVPAGRVSDEPWMFADFLPTCAELVGMPVPPDPDSRSVMPVLTGMQATLGDRPFYWEFPRDRLQQAVRLGRWKARRSGLDGVVQLHDLAADPTEERDIAAEHPAVVARLRALLDAYHQPSPHWPVR